MCDSDSQDWGSSRGCSRGCSRGSTSSTACPGLWGGHGAAPALLTWKWSRLCPGAAAERCSNLPGLCLLKRSQNLQRLLQLGLLQGWGTSCACRLSFRTAEPSSRRPRTARAPGVRGGRIHLNESPPAPPVGWGRSGAGPGLSLGPHGPVPGQAGGCPEPPRALHRGFFVPRRQTSCREMHVCSIIPIKAQLGAD